MFKDVFGDTDLVETYDYSGLNRRLFNNIVADALENHKAISIDESQMAGGHAITCWGFRFDENGYVDRLYYTDSATPWDNTLTKRDLSLSYITIKYDESQNWRVYMESAIKVNGVVEHGRLPIITVYSYSLGTELWEDYFAIEALGEYTLICKDASGHTFDEMTVKPSAEAQITLPSYPFRTAVRATVDNQELSIGDSHTVSIANIETRTIVLEYNDNLPFNITPIINGQFVEPQWYQLCTTMEGSRYALQYDKDNNRLEGAAVADSPYEAQLWCLTGNMSDGFRLYNKQEGANLALTYTSESGNPVLGTPEASTAVWTIAPASTAGLENPSTDSFCLKAPAGEGENIYLYLQNDEILFTSLPGATAIWSAILYNGGTSSIDQPSLSPTTEDEEYYDLQGRRVKNPTRGIYITKSGKKVLLLQQP